MNPSEKVFKQTRLRNLKRRYTKLKQHSEFAEECIEIKADIDALERELKLI